MAPVGVTFAALSRNFARVLSRALSHNILATARARRRGLARRARVSSRHISAEYAFQKPRFGDTMVVFTIYTHRARHVHPLAVDSVPVKMLYPHRDGPVRGMTRDCTPVDNPAPRKVDFQISS